MEKEDKIYMVVLLFLVIGIGSLFSIFIKGIDENSKEDKDSISTCTNIKKFYKDDIFFDNFYIACDEPINREISPDLYTRIEEGENYIITFTKGGDIYSIEKAD